MAIQGTNGPDVLVGSYLKGIIFPLLGDDVIRAGGGNDSYTLGPILHRQALAKVMTVSMVRPATTFCPAMAA